MSEATAPESTQPKPPRRGKWRRRAARGLLLGFVALALFHQPLLREGLRLAAVRLAARENVTLSLELEGSVWTNLTLKNLRAIPTGTSPVVSITIERLRAQYSLRTLLRRGARDFLTSYELRNANLVLDPVKGNEDQRQKLAHALRDILQQPALFSDRAQIENFNLTLRASEGTYFWKNVCARLDPQQAGYVRVGELTIPNLGSWRDLHTQATYINRHLVMRDFSLGEEVRVARLELDTSKRDNGISYLSFEGTVLGGDLGLFLWQRKHDSGAVEAQVTAFLSDMSMAALSKYAGWKVPVTGNLKSAWIQLSGDPLSPVHWQGQLTAEVQNGAIGQVAIEEASAKLTVGGGVAKLESLRFSTGKNSLSFQAERPLPESFDLLHFSDLDATFAINAPELARLHGALAGGRVQGAGRMHLDGGKIALEGKFDAADIRGKAFALQSGSGEFQWAHSLHPNASGAPWYEGLSGHVRAEAADLRFGQFAVRSLRLDVPVNGEEARIAELALDINGKDKLNGKATVSLREPFAYEATLAGSVEDIAIFQPLLQTPVAGALEIDWHGSGQIALLRHTGEGRVALRKAAVGTFTGVEGELAGVYSPESIDITALRLRSDQGTFQAGVRLHDQRLKIEQLRLTAGKTGVVTGNLSLPLDLRTPTIPETVFPPSGALQGALRMEQIDLAKAFPAVRPGFGVRGLVEGALTVGGTLAAPDVSASVRARDFQTDAAAKLTPAAGDATFLFKNNRLVLSGSLAQPGLSTLGFKGSMPLVLREALLTHQLNPATPIVFSVTLPPSPAGLFAPLLPGVRLLEGRLSVDASATGTLEKPVFSGGIALDLPAIRFHDADLPAVNHFLGDLRFSGSELTFQRFSGDVAGGPFSVTGRLRLDKLSDPLLDLRFHSEGTLLARNDTLTLRADSDLRIAGPVNKAHVTGSLGFTKSRFFREIEILPIGLPGRPAPQPSAGWFELSTDTAPFRDWTFDVTVKTAEAFAVRGNLANGSIEGSLHLGGSGLAPTLEGTAHIENFVASLPFSRLTVDHGALYFSGNEALNPTLDIHGSSRIRDYNINVYLYGTASEPQTLFTSEPSLPQEEIIALLATGATTRDFAQNNQALAGRAAVLLFQDLYRKVFPKRKTPENTRNPMDRFSLDVGTVDPRSGRQELMGRFKLSSEYQIGAGVDMQGDMRMELQYLLRFR